MCVCIIDRTITAYNKTLSISALSRLLIIDIEFSIFYRLTKLVSRWQMAIIISIFTACTRSFCLPRDISQPCCSPGSVSCRRLLICRRPSCCLIDKRALHIYRALSFNLPNTLEILSVRRRLLHTLLLLPKKEE